MTKFITSTTTIEDVKDFIRTANRQELKEIAKIHTTAIKLLLQEETGQFQKGDIVTINHESTSSSVIYEVTRVSKKTITVKNDGLVRSFRVSPQFLEKATISSFPKLK